MRHRHLILNLGAKSQREIDNLIDSTPVINPYSQRRGDPDESVENIARDISFELTDTPEKQQPATQRTLSASRTGVSLADMVKGKAEPPAQTVTRKYSGPATPYEQTKDIRASYQKLDDIFSGRELKQIREDQKLGKAGPTPLEQQLKREAGAYKAQQKKERDAKYSHLTEADKERARRLGLSLDKYTKATSNPTVFDTARCPWV